MKKEKFMEKAEKRARKKLASAVENGRLTREYTVTGRMEDSSISLVFNRPGTEPIVLFLNDFYAEREEDDCSVKEILSAPIREMIDCLADYEATRQDHTIEPETTEEAAPTVEPNAPVEEPGQEGGEGNRNDSDTDFHNDIHDNCGIPTDPNYYTLTEFCDAIRPYVASKLRIAEEDIIIFPQENESTGESFYKLTLIGQEQGPEVDLNALYRDYRTSEDEDEKLLNKAAKSIKRQFKEEEQAEAQRENTEVEIDANIIQMEVMPALGFAGENLLTDESKYGPVAYYLPRTDYRDEIFLTEEDLTRFQISKEDIASSAMSHLEEAAMENPPTNPADGTEIPNVIVCGKAEYALLDTYLQSAYELLDKKDNVFLSFSEEAFLMYFIETAPDSALTKQDLLQIRGTDAESLICDTFFTVSERDGAVLVTPFEEREQPEQEMGE